MANKYAGTQTEKNLEAAFAGESMARNKYTYFASKAKKEGFGHGAADTLNFVTEELIPGLKERYGLPSEVRVILGGYSLAAFFALWSAYQTDRFAAVSAASPSVWFPGWIDYAQSHTVKTEHVYLSLGNKEEKTRNQVIKWLKS